MKTEKVLAGILWKIWLGETTKINEKATWSDRLTASVIVANTIGSDSWDRTKKGVAQITLAFLEKSPRIREKIEKDLAGGKGKSRLSANLALAWRTIESR